MSIAGRIFHWLGGGRKPTHLRRGELGERAARRHLQKLGLKFLAANFRADDGEIDLVFKDSQCLVFVEVKTRSSEEWVRPAAAVNQEKRRLVARAARAYLKQIHNPPVKVRFDIVEVLLAEDQVREIRHWPNAFSPAQPQR